MAGAPSARESRRGEVSAHCSALRRRARGGEIATGLCARVSLCEDVRDVLRESAGSLAGSLGLGAPRDRTLIELAGPAIALDRWPELGPGSITLTHTKYI